MLRDQCTISSARQRRGADAALSSSRLLDGLLHLPVQVSQPRHVDEGRRLLVCAWWASRRRCRRILARTRPGGVQLGPVREKAVREGCHWRCNVVSVVNRTALTACPSQRTACGKTQCYAPSVHASVMSQLLSCNVLGLERVSHRCCKVMFFKFWLLSVW